MGRVSQYRTNIKRIAFSLVTHGYSLSDNQTEREKQVESLLLKDKFIFEPKEGVCPQLLFFPCDSSSNL
jgi:hypothetical protein